VLASRRRKWERELINKTGAFAAVEGPLLSQRMVPSPGALPPV
jgi:hypothetical protein